MLMDSRELRSFLILVKRELWESRNLFIASPLVLAGLLTVGLVWALLQVPSDLLSETATQLGSSLEGLPATNLAPFFMPVAIPFVMVLFVCSLIYLINALYQDRKDSSILFWQSMPVSNMKTVLSKVFVVCFMAPLFVAGAIALLVIVAMLTLSLLGVSYGITIVGFGAMLLAGIYSVLLVYLTAVLAALWLFPTVGWVLLFSAYARGLPFLWAIGSFILLLFLEDLVFGTQFLGNWVESRSNNYNYIIFQISDFFNRLFSYDMLFGIALGALLITGSVYMRRYTD